jgi:hypothetical protein
MENSEISISEIFIKWKEWLSFLKTKGIKLLIISIIFGLLSIFLSFFQKPNYKAVLTFAMEEDKASGGGLSNALGLASSFGIDLGGSTGGGAFAASNLAALMKSHLIIDNVLLDAYVINGKKKTLAEFYIEVSGLRKKWHNNSKLKNVEFPINEDRTKFNLIKDSILNQLHKELTKQDNLDISQKDKKVTILTLEVNSPNELFSKIFCEAVANKTSDLYVSTKSKKARLNTFVLQKQTDSVRSVLNNNIIGVAKAADNVYNLNPSLNTKGSNSKKIQLEITANTEVLKQLLVQLELSKITLRKETPLIQVIDTPRFPLENDKSNLFLSFIFGTLSGFVFSILYFITVKLFKK